MAPSPLFPSPRESGGPGRIRQARPPLGAPFRGHDGNCAWVPSVRNRSSGARRKWRWAQRNGLARRKALEMLRQRQALALIGGADLGPVQLVRPGDQPLIDEPANHLTI